MRATSFESYLVDRSNDAAYQAVLGSTLAGDDARPLAISGPSGSGKTHLLAAAAAQVHDRRRDATVWCATGRQFADQYVHAIRNAEVHAFHEWLCRCDVVFLDDLDLLAGEEGVQAELAHVVRRASTTQFVFAVRSFAELGRLRARILSRPKGAVERLGRPGVELRRRLLQARTAERGLTVSEEVLGLVRHLPVSCGDVVGFAQRLAFFTELWGEPCSKELAEWVLARSGLVRVRHDS